MKKILWIVGALILVLAGYHLFATKHHGHDHSDHQHAHSESENTADEKPIKLNSEASLVNARVIAPPPGSSVAAAYMTIANSGQTTAKLVSIESDDFEEMMFHKTVIENGVASMQHLEFLEVPSGGSVKLEPNGMHVMAMEPERELKAGDQVSIRFTFDNGETYSATVPVR